VYCDLFCRAQRRRGGGGISAAGLGGKSVRRAEVGTGGSYNKTGMRKRRSLQET